MVEHGEDRLLDLSCVSRTRHENLSCRKVHDDRGLGVRAVPCRVSMEVWCMQDGELRLKAFLLLRRKAEEHVVGEQRVPRALADHPNIQAVRLVRSCSRVVHEEVRVVQMLDNVGAQGIEVLGSHRHIDGAPVDH